MMQSFIKTEFSSSLNETSSSNTNSDIYHQASSNLINNNNNKDKCSSQTFGSLICRKRLDFDTNTNQNVSYSSPPSSAITLSDKMRHKSITSNKKNTAIVAGTIQMNSVLKQQNQECFNGGETSSLKPANRGQQFVKVPSNTKRNARERKRVRTINDYFSKLQKYLPHSKQPTSTTTPPPSSLSINASKKLSKVETLKAAIDYIEYLLTFAPSCRYNNSSSNSNSKSQTNSSNVTINATSVASLTPCTSSASPSSLSTSASSPSSSILSSPSSCFSTSMSSSNSTCEKPSKCNTKATSTKSVCSSPSSSSVLTLTNKSLKSHQDTSMTPVNSSPLTSTLPITSSNINYECSNNNSANFYTTQPNSYQLSGVQSEFRSSSNSYGSYAMESTPPTTNESCYYAQQQYAAHPTQSFANYLPNDTINRMVVDMHVYAESPLIATSSNSCSPLSHNTSATNRNIISNVGLTSPNNHHQFNESHHHHNNTMIHNHNHHQTSLQNPYNGYHVAPEIYYN